MNTKNLEVERRRAEATEVFEKYPNAVSKDLQKKILALQIDVGMDPYMARLAGGVCSFKITPDREKWHPGANPYQVMDAQSLHPDNSEIWLTFQNDTQYPGRGLTTFTVLLVNGRVAKIEEINKI